MVQQVIDVGLAPDDGEGDPLRTAYQKTNENFTELFGGRALSDFSNVTEAEFTGSLIIRGSTGEPLLFVDPDANQVSIGAGPINPFRKFYVESSSPDMTVAGQTTGHDAITSRMDCTGPGTAAINPNGVYGTLWYRPTIGAANYNGAGAAVRGNAYTIDTPFAADVTNLIGVYGRARHENALGTVQYAIGLFSDGAQKGPVGGAIVRAIGVFVQAPVTGGLNFGVYFNNTPNSGHIASNVGTNITVAPGEAISWTFSSLGYSIAKSGDKGVVQLGTWGELIETQGAFVGIGANLYSNRSTGGFEYRNTHAAVGGCLMLHNAAGFQTTSFFFSPPAAAGQVATISEAFRIINAPALNETSIIVYVNLGAAPVIKPVLVGAPDSGGVGFRMLRIAN